MNEKRFVSHVQWPKGSIAGSPDDISTDYHLLRSGAEYCCEWLKEHGMGGDGKVFPIKTWVTSEFEDPTLQDQVEELQKIQKRVFDIANSFSGDETGAAAVYLHGACNRISKALDILEMDDPSQAPIPAGAMLASLGVEGWD